MNPRRLIPRISLTCATAICLSLSLLATLPAYAIEIVRSSPHSESGAVALREENGKLILNLDDAIIIALRNNLGLRVNRYQRAQADEAIRQNLGIFDALMSTTAFAFSESVPAASTLDGALVQQFEGQGLNLQLDQLFSSGGNLLVDWTNQRSENNSLFSQVNPSFTVGFDLTFTQPLLRSFGSNATKRNIIISRTNSEISLETLTLQIIDVIELVENTYWSLVEGQLQLEVARESLELARSLHRMNEVQVRVGTMAPLELTQSDVGVAQRQEALLRADAIAEDTADQLRGLLSVAEDRYWELDIEPATDPMVARLEFSVEDGIATAFRERGEIHQQELRLRNLEVDRKFQRSLGRPGLDWQVRYGYNGLGGDVLDRTDPTNPTIIPGGYSDAIRQIVDRDFKGWQTGVTFQFPLQNRQGKAGNVIAELALEQGGVELEDLKLAIRTEVRRTARGVETAAEAIDLAQVTRELAEKQLDAEQKRYDNGLSTSFEVLQIQEDLSEARSSEVNSITSYRRALVLYYKAIGRLLQENDIELEDNVVTE